MEQTDEVDPIMDKVQKAINAVKEKNVNVFTAGAREQVEKPFVMLFTGALAEVVKSGAINMTDMRVMLALCDIAAYGNLLSLNQTGLASVMGLHKSALSRSFKKLLKENLLINTKLGLFLNPSLIIKGRIDKIDPQVWDASLLQTPNAYPLKKQRGTKTAKQLRAEAES
jgi:DNA-binding MarR family transcriptional regulator